MGNPRFTKLCVRPAAVFEYTLLTLQNHNEGLFFWGGGGNFARTVKFGEQYLIC
jgi:hypothetical protein